LRILYVTSLYLPEPGAHPMRVAQISRHLVARGHEVTVLTDVPNHPHGKVYAGHGKKLLKLTYSEMDGEVRVVRVPQIFRPNRGSIDRLLAFSSFTVTAALRSLTLGPFDVVIGTIPQPFSPLAPWLRSFVGKAKFVLEIRDLWPESIVATGQGSSSSIAYKGIGAMVGFLYRRADQFITVTDGIKQALVESHGVSAEKINVVRAGVDPESLKSSVDQQTAKEQLGLEGQFVVTYLGTVGYAHGVDIMLEMAERLRDDHPDISLLVVGTGAEEKAIRELVSDRGYQNIKILGQKPRSELPDILVASDIGLALLRPSEVFKTAVPTKIYEYMATGLPVLTNVAGETTGIITESKSGIAIPDGNARALTEEIIKLQSNPDSLRTKSAAGAQHAQETASWAGRAEQFEQALVKIAR
jgi:colanic acid biosynthesis glycosyl transferase WcaI